MAEEPAAEPTEEPTPAPEKQVQPDKTNDQKAADPTVEPTTEPTDEPTTEPTIEPTTLAEPFVDPTADPTVEPSAVEPTQEAAPLVAPTTQSAPSEDDDQVGHRAGRCPRELQQLHHGFRPRGREQPRTRTSRRRTATTSGPTATPTTYREKDYINFRFIVTSSAAANGRLTVNFTGNGGKCDFFDGTHRRWVGRDDHRDRSWFRSRARLPPSR